MIDRRKFMRDTALLTVAASVGGELFAEDAVLPTREIPSTGEAMPIVGFGNSQSFRDNDYENSRALLDVLIEKGGRFVDLSGGSQVPLGHYMRDHDAHDELFLGTNISGDDGPDDLRLIAESKALQGKDPLDLIQLPRPSDFAAQWRRLRDWKARGYTRYIGIAIANNDWYELVEQAIATDSADFVQLNYSMLEPESGERLIPMAADHGVAVITNRPFVNGRYFPLVRDKALPDWASEFDCESWAQFSLKFIVANPHVTCAITETSKTHHALDNLSAGFGRLPDEPTRERMLELIRSF